MTDLARLAATLRDRAAAPVPSPLPKQYVEGFCDGLRLAADVVDAVRLLEDSAADAPPGR